METIQSSVLKAWRASTTTLLSTTSFLPQSFAPLPNFFLTLESLPNCRKGEGRLDEGLLTLEACVATTLPSRDVEGIVNSTTSRLSCSRKTNYPQVSPLNRSRHTRNGTTDYVSRAVVGRRLGRSCSSLIAEALRARSLRLLFLKSVDRWVGADG